jgi:kinesin family protein 3/17
MIINPFSEENGIIPRSINYLFSELEIFNLKSKKYNVYINFLQIYSENIYDLLDEEQNLEKQTSLKIREDKINGIYVEDLSEFLVENVYDCLNLLKRGERTRRRRQSIKNDINSRSHTILQIIVEYDRVTEKGILKVNIY